MPTDRGVVRTVLAHAQSSQAKPSQAKGSEAKGSEVRAGLEGSRSEWGFTLRCYGHGMPFETAKRQAMHGGTVNALTCIWPMHAFTTPLRMYSCGVAGSTCARRRCGSRRQR